MTGIWPSGRRTLTHAALLLGLAGCSAAPQALVSADESAIAAVGDVDGLATACAQGDVRACYGAGLAYLADSLTAARERGAAGDEIGPLHRRGHDLLEFACAGDAPVPEACNLLGDLAMAGLGTEQDPRRAVALYRVACAGGNSGACNHLGDAVAHGIGVAADPRAALELFQRSCRGTPPNPTACMRAGARLDEQQPGDGGLRPEVEQLYRAACSGGSPVGCMHLANATAVRLGRVPPPSRDSAYHQLREDSVLSVYRAVCHAGQMLSCQNLALEYHHPEALGGARDLDSATLYYRRSCEGGHGSACERLGSLLIERGDTARALHWYGQGCSQLDAAACVNLAFHERQFSDNERVFFNAMGCLRGAGSGCTRFGRFAEIALERIDFGLEYYRRGCDLRDAASCSHAAIVYGVRREFALEAQYRARACAIDTTMEVCQKDS